MLVNRHLQKVLFTADEAHCASHPSKARAHSSQLKPIQNFTTRCSSVTPLLRCSLLWLYSAQTSDKCAQSPWHHCDFKRVSPHLFSATMRWLTVSHTEVRWLPTAHTVEDNQVACSIEVLLSLPLYVSPPLFLSLTHTHTPLYLCFDVVLWLVLQTVAQN